MTSTFTKLSDLKLRREEREARLAQRPKATWFSNLLTNAHGKIKIRFMQEISDEAELYNPLYGTFFGAVEHQAPGKNGYRSRALDTMDTEGKDWAQEQHVKEPRLGWGPKENFYINVACETKSGEVEPAILSRPIGSEFVENLIDIYEESDGKGITDKTYWLEKRGLGPKTRWKLTKVKDPDEQISLDGIEPFNLEECAVIRVPYAEQEAFYMRNADIAGAKAALEERDAKRGKEDADEAQQQGLGKPEYKW